MANQHDKGFQINEDDLVWDVQVIPASSRYRSMRGQFEVSVRCPVTQYAGWAIRKTERAARDQALMRLYYARDCALAAHNH